MHFRQAEVSDIHALFDVRMSVKENVLVNLNLVTEELCIIYLTSRGRGWVCEQNGEIIGFGIIDYVGSSIWALFVRPEHEGKGIGKTLMGFMLGWYFGQTDGDIWLSTSAGTRAETFYRKTGWVETGNLTDVEIRFELTKRVWERQV